MSNRAKRMAARTAILIVAGISAFAAGAIVVHAATSAHASAKKKKLDKPQPSFLLRTQVTDQLAPGKTVPLKVAFANNRTVALWFKRLDVVIAVDQAHVNAGCSADRDYRVEQIPGTAFPFKLGKKKKPRVIHGRKIPAKTNWRMLPLNRSRGKPTLTMLALPDVNQDACKGATLTISYSTAISTKRPKPVRTSK